MTVSVVPQPVTWLPMPASYTPVAILLLLRWKRPHMKGGSGSALEWLSECESLLGVCFSCREGGKALEKLVMCGIKADWQFNAAGGKKITCFPPLPGRAGAFPSRNKVWRLPSSALNSSWPHHRNCARQNACHAAVGVFQVLVLGWLFGNAPSWFTFLLVCALGCFSTAPGTLLFGLRIPFSTDIFFCWVRDQLGYFFGTLGRG